MLEQKLGHNILGVIAERYLNHPRIYPAKILNRDDHRRRTRPIRKRGDHWKGVQPIHGDGRIIPPHDLYLGWNLGHPDRQRVGGRRRRKRRSGRGGLSDR